MEQATDTAIAALKDEMARNGSGRDGPVRSIAATIGDRWSALILLVLATGTWRHAELRRTLGELSDEGGISQRVLTLKLRALERDGFVAREVSAHVPPKVRYELTALGSGLVSQIRGLIAWCGDKAEAVIDARARFDGTPGY